MAMVGVIQVGEAVNMEEIRSAWKAVPGLMSSEKAPKSIKSQTITN